MDKIKKAQNHRVTIKDIASLAKVSIGTVDRVLHNRGEVNPETRNRVMTIVKELGYTPNLIAKSLAMKKNFSIAVLIPAAGESNPYWKKPVAGFMLASHELNDFSTKITLYHYDLGDESSFIREFGKILTLNPDGIILAPHFHDAAVSLVRKCKAQDIPCIFIDNNLEDEPCLAYFGQDAFQSGKVAAKLMNYGLKKNSKVLILNLAPNKAITHHMQRRESGFVDYFRTEVPGNTIRTVSVAIDMSLETEPSSTLRHVLAEHPDTDGIFVTNSRIHKIAGHLGSIGKASVKLIGYDLVDENLTYLEKGLIDVLICQKPEDQGYRSAMAMFYFLLNGRTAEKVNYTPIDIIIRENFQYYKNDNL